MIFLSVLLLDAWLLPRDVAGTMRKKERFIGNWITGVIGDAAPIFV